MTSSPFLNDIRRFMRTRGYSLRTGSFQPSCPKYCV